MMYSLTKAKDSLSDGAYATVDTEGNTVVQLFVEKEDAICYNVQLEALGHELHVTEIPDDGTIDRVCEYMGYAYSVVEPGEFVVPRIETIKETHKTDNDYLP